MRKIATFFGGQAFDHRSVDSITKGMAPTDQMDQRSGPTISGSAFNLEAYSACAIRRLASRCPIRCESQHPTGIEHKDPIVIDTDPCRAGHLRIDQPVSSRQRCRNCEENGCQSHSRPKLLPHSDALRKTVENVPVITEPYKPERDLT
jgi:hypothetical protein